MKLSLFKKNTPANPSGTITLEGLLTEIRDGAHRNPVDRVRQAVTDGKPKDVINDLKRELQSITISGEITGGGRSNAMNENRFIHSGLIQIDIDGATNPEAVRDMLANDPHIVCAFLSPTARGVKAVAMVETCATVEDHQAAFLTAERYYFTTYGLQIDKSTKDPVRLCYVSHDSEAKWNDSATPLQIIRQSEPPKENNPPTVNRKRELSDLAAMLAPMPERLEYDSWLRVCSGAWNEYGEEATETLAAKWPEEHHGEYGEKYRHRLKDCTLGTVIHYAKENGWSGTTKEAITFSFISADEIESGEGAFDFVENLLTEGAASVIYGASNSGKTFFALDIAAHVATGREWMESECEQGAVIYIALEGHHGARNRIVALQLTGRLPKGAPFFLCFSPVNLLDASHPAAIKRLIENVQTASPHPVRLVIIDTLARAMAGGDENSGEDMGQAVASIDTVRNATGAHVCIIHHSGKDAARGARGHSSLRAAIDTEIEVVHPDGDKYRTATVVKQRDIATRPPICFSLDVVKVGINRRAKEITSCIVIPEDSIMAHSKGKPGRKQLYTCEMILELLPQPDLKAWEKAAEITHGMKSDTFHSRKRECANRWHKGENQITLKPLENQGEWVNGLIEIN